MKNGITKIIEELDHLTHSHYNHSTVFNDWIDIMLYALQRDDEQYMHIVNKYKTYDLKDIREIGNFCNAFALLMLEMKHTNDDILGQVYMQWNINNKQRGQFFTPSHIASMMACIVSPKGKVLDPCCGSGVMLVEAIKSMKPETIEQSVFFGQDSDLTCVKMCALNLLFFNVDGYVIWGDSLAMTCSKVYQTKRTFEGGVIRELKDEDLEAFKKLYGVMYENSVKTSDSGVSQEVQLINQSQLTLF